MNIEKILELASKAGQTEQHEAGQVTLGYLRDMLAKFPADMPCMYDTGHNFGNEPVEFEKVEAFNGTHYSYPEHDSAESENAYPSCYRGYYSDCTFNARKDYPVSTVGHVLSMVEGAIGHRRMTTPTRPGWYWFMPDGENQ